MVPKFVKSSMNVPPVMVSPPVMVETAEPLRTSVPVPAVVKPEEPLMTNAVLFPMVAVFPIPTVTVGEVPEKTKTGC